MAETILHERYVSIPRLTTLMNRLCPRQWTYQVCTITGNPWPTKMKSAATESPSSSSQHCGGKILIRAPVALTQVRPLLTCQAWSPRAALTLPQEQQDYIMRTVNDE
jgi:hypothetical protein